jgi:hypothetical protein
MVKNLVATLAPGGWLQVQELDVMDHGVKSAASDMKTIIRELYKSVGTSLDFRNGLEGAFRDAGLEEVSVRTAALPVGRKLGSDEAAKMSIGPMKMSISSLVGACRRE